MTQQIVHLLEAVQIDQQDGQHVLVAVSAENRLLQAILEQTPVGEIRERIAHRLQRQLLIHGAVLDDDFRQFGEAFEQSGLDFPGRRMLVQIHIHAADLLPHAG